MSKGFNVRKTLPAITGFANGGGNHEPWNAGRQTLEAGKGQEPWSLQKELDFSPVRSGSGF